jgi:carboxylesterase type B
VYDGYDFAAREDIVYVSFNYRTNGVCFLSSPQLDPSLVYLHIANVVRNLETLLSNNVQVFGFPSSPNLPIEGRNL